MRTFLLFVAMGAGALRAQTVGDVSLQPRTAGGACVAGGDEEWADAGGEELL